MRNRRRKALSRKVALASLGLFVAIVTVFGIQYFTATGVFAKNGQIIYDSTLTDSEISELKQIFPDDLKLRSDLKISAVESLKKPENSKAQYLVEIYVPVTDFYSSRENLDFSLENPISSVTDDSSDSISSVGAESSDATSSATEQNTNPISSVASLASSNTAVAENVYFIPISSLNNQMKLLSLNNDYYLDKFSSGAVFRALRFESAIFDSEIAPYLGLPGKSFSGEKIEIPEFLSKTFPSKDTVLTFAQTGVTALSRHMNEKLASVGDPTYFSANIRDFLSSFDLTHTSNESSFSDLASPENICSNPAFENTLLDIGLDIVELTGNHNEDCGDEAAASSIDFYNSKNIRIVGGGKTAAEAAEPLKISEKGNNITFLAYNLSTGGATYDDTPGANQYYEEDAATKISAAKGKGDFVIVDIQYYECPAYASEYEDETCDFADAEAGDEIGFFRHLIDLGADLVVGTSAHQPQTYEIYNNGVIYYGLGNLFFDQSWWPGTTRSLVLGNYYYNSKLLQTKLTVTKYDENYQPSLADPETQEYLLSRLAKNRPTDAANSTEILENHLNENH